MVLTVRAVVDVGPHDLEPVVAIGLHFHVVGDDSPVGHGGRRPAHRHRVLRAGLLHQAHWWAGAWPNTTRFKNQTQ